MSEEKASRQRRIYPERATLRHGRVEPITPLGLIFRTIAIGLSVLLLASVSIAGIAAWQISRGANEGVALANEQRIPDIGAIEGGVNMLIVGSDSREGQGGSFGDTSGVLNDVNILLHISADHTSATAISIPRDMVVPMADCPDGGGGWTGPINAVLSEGGLACVVTTVEELTGLKIPFAALVQFNGVIELSNAVGGVEVCVAEPLEDAYTGINLQPGNHTLSGSNALAFLRARHGVGDGSDLGRISNQQVFLSALVRKLKAADTLANPVKLFAIAKAVTANMSLSNSLNNLDTLVSIAMALKDIPLDAVNFIQFPGSTGGEGVYAGKVEPDMTAAQTIFAALLADQPVQLTGGTGIGSVSSGTPSESQPTPEGSASSSSPPTPKPVTVALPSEVNGQNASQVTCSNGRSFSEQDPEDQPDY